MIHFDIDPAEINKNVEVDVAVLGDCKESLPVITDLLKTNTNREQWITSFEEYEAIEKNPVIDKELNPTTRDLSMGEVVNAVSAATNHQAILVTDVGQNQMASARYFKFSKKEAL